MFWLEKYFMLMPEDVECATRQLIILYDQALAKNELRHFERHGLNFDYALIDTKKFQKKRIGVDPLSKWVYHHKYAFAIRRNPEEDFSLIFICGDLVPSKFWDIPGVHEYGDITYQKLGDIKKIHEKSIKLEFDIAKKEGLFDEYLEWIRKNHPGRMKELSKIGII
jgi:hypothetical protein